jgi:RNA-directed DNA polymerase
MMYGTEKSDSPILPEKLANKAERSAAESVEGSGGTKRNAELQSTVRIQSWVAVSQAQDRIRGAVTRNRKEKLTALLHHVNVDTLRWAFLSLKSRMREIRPYGSGAARLAAILAGESPANRKEFRTLL